MIMNFSIFFIFGRFFQSDMKLRLPSGYSTAGRSYALAMSCI